MRKSYTYTCSSCNQLKQTSRASSYICRPCLARKNAKKANKAAVKVNTLRPYEALYRVLMRNATVGGHEINLTYEDFLKLTKNKHCSYCGQTLKWSKFSKKSGMVTNIDRKDSKLGYSLDNCVPCCGKCNKIKNDFFSYEEFIQIVKFTKEIRGFW